MQLVCLHISHHQHGEAILAAHQSALPAGPCQSLDATLHPANRSATTRAALGRNRWYHHRLTHPTSRQPPWRRSVQPSIRPSPQPGRRLTTNCLSCYQQVIRRLSPNDSRLFNRRCHHRVNNRVSPYTNPLDNRQYPLRHTNHRRNHRRRHLVRLAGWPAGNLGVSRRRSHHRNPPVSRLHEHLLSLPCNRTQEAPGW